MSVTLGFDAGLALQAALATEKAAIGASSWIGKGQEKAADQGAVDQLRTALNAMNIRGRIVIGEGERDEAPMLFIGEEVGKGKGPEIDIALDPLEGTTLTAKAMANALAVMAFAPRGGLLYAPDVYMDKIAVGPGYKAGVVDLDKSAADNARALADAKGCKVEDLTVCVLDRTRHSKIIDDLRSVNARILLITDGDVQGVINTTDKDTGVDLYIGQGGAPEGVLAAAALRCVGGQMQGRLHFRNDDEVARARRVGIDDLDKKYDLKGLASGPTIFSATGVTDGQLLDGVKIRNGRVTTETLIMNSVDGSVQRLRSDRPLQVETNEGPYCLDVQSSYRGLSWRWRCEDAAKVEALTAQASVDNLTARLLAGRGVVPEDAANFLDPKLRDFLPNPSVMQDMDKAAEAIVKALKSKQKVTIFADYDVDGGTSAAQIVRWARHFGVEFGIYVPDRVEEGYGPTIGAFQTLKRQGNELIITVDCGAAAYGALEEAAKIDLPVVVIDHHMMHGDMPPALALVNPNRPDDTSGLGHLAAAGVCFVLLVALLG